jgi:hypothetical protein
MPSRLRKISNVYFSVWIVTFIVTFIVKVGGHIALLGLIKRIKKTLSLMSGTNKKIH